MQLPDLKLFLTVILLIIGFLIFRHQRQSENQLSGSTKKKPIFSREFILSLNDQDARPPPPDFVDIRLHYNKPSDSDDDTASVSISSSTNALAGWRRSNGSTVVKKKPKQISKSQSQLQLLIMKNQATQDAVNSPLIDEQFSAEEKTRQRELLQRIASVRASEKVPVDRSAPEIRTLRDAIRKVRTPQDVLVAFELLSGLIGRFQTTSFLESHELAELAKLSIDY